MAVTSWFAPTWSPYNSSPQFFQDTGNIGATPDGVYATVTVDNNATNYDDQLIATIPAAGIPANSSILGVEIEVTAGTSTNNSWKPFATFTPASGNRIAFSGQDTNGTPITSNIGKNNTVNSQTIGGPTSPPIIYGFYSQFGYTLLTTADYNSGASKIRVTFFEDAHTQGEVVSVDAIRFRFYYSDPPIETGAKTGTNALSTGGTTPWANPANGLTSNNVYTTNTTSVTTANNPYFVANGFDFSSIPANATITGITMVLERKYTGGTTGNVRDAVVQLTKDSSAVVGTNLARTTTNWGTTDSFNTYGATNNLWGTTWTPSELQNTNFGVVIQAVGFGTGANRVANIDSVTVNVAYTVPTGETVPVDKLSFTQSLFNPTVIANEAVTVDKLSFVQSFSNVNAIENIGVDKLNFNQSLYAPQTFESTVVPVDKLNFAQTVYAPTTNNKDVNPVPKLAFVQTLHVPNTNNVVKLPVDKLGFTQTLRVPNTNSTEKLPVDKLNFAHTLYVPNLNSTEAVKVDMLSFAQSLKEPNVRFNEFVPVEKLNFAQTVYAPTPLSAEIVSVDKLYFKQKLMVGTEFVPATNVVNVTSSAGLWANPGNATLLDGLAAVATGKTGIPNTTQMSANASDNALLRANGFGFNVPSGATITSIIGRLYRRADTGFSSIYDDTIQLVKNDAPFGSNQSTGAEWVQSDNFGQVDFAFDNPSITPEEVNSSNFGLQLRTVNSSSVGATAYVSPTGNTVEQGTGGFGWVYPFFIYASDNSRAMCTSPGGTLGDVAEAYPYLNTVGFSPNVPSTAQIVSIEVSIEAYRTGGTVGEVKFDTVQLTMGGVRVGTPKSGANNVPVNDTYQVFGNIAGDLWGLTPTASQVNSGLGVSIRMVGTTPNTDRVTGIDHIRLRVGYAGIGNGTVYVDSMQMQVNYAMPAGETIPVDKLNFAQSLYTPFISAPEVVNVDKLNFAQSLYDVTSIAAEAVKVDKLNFVQSLSNVITPALYSTDWIVPTNLVANPRGSSNFATPFNIQTVDQQYASVVADSGGNMGVLAGKIPAGLIPAGARVVGVEIQAIGNYVAAFPYVIVGTINAASGGAGYVGIAFTPGQNTGATTPLGANGNDYRSVGGGRQMLPNPVTGSPALTTADFNTELTVQIIPKRQGTNATMTPGNQVNLDYAAFRISYLMSDEGKSLIDVPKIDFAQTLYEPRANGAAVVAVDKLNFAQSLYTPNVNAKDVVAVNKLGFVQSLVVPKTNERINVPKVSFVQTLYAPVAIDRVSVSKLNFAQTLNPVDVKASTVVAVDKLNFAQTLHLPKINEYIVSPKLNFVQTLGNVGLTDKVVIDKLNFSQELYEVQLPMLVSVPKLNFAQTLYTPRTVQDTLPQVKSKISWTVWEWNEAGNSVKPVNYSRTERVFIAAKITGGKLPTIPLITGAKISLAEPHEMDDVGT